MLDDYLINGIIVSQKLIHPISIFMTEIALEGMSFYAYHGFYEEERTNGGHYKLNVTVKINNYTSLDDNIKDTVNYENIYSVCQRHMSISYKLIETVGLNIANEIKHEFKECHAVIVRVEKLNPPIKGDIEKAVVTITV